MIKTQSTLTFRILFTFTLIFLLCSNSVIAQDKKSQIESLVQKYYDYGKFSGSILVSDNAKVIFKKGYGLANMERKANNFK